MLRRRAFYILIACASVFMIFAGYMANKVTVRDITSPSQAYNVKYNTRGSVVYISKYENMIIYGDDILTGISLCGLFIFYLASRKGD